jgi:L-fuculose-phosphate aldolase
MLTAMGDVMRRCYEKGWITTRDGNVSLRLKDKNYIYITPSGVRKNKIEVENIIKLPLAGPDGSVIVIPPGTSPSGELHMHHMLQMIEPNRTKTVLHVHPTHILAAMYAGWDLQKLAAEFPEVSRYTKVGPTVPILPATSKELGNETFINMTQNKAVVWDIVGQDRHGVCVVARHPWEAYEHVERLDHVCEIVLKSGVRPKT